MNLSQISLSRILVVMLLIVTFFFSSIYAMSQVSGTITDTKTGKPIRGVEVFINCTTIATQTDEIGQFNLSNVPTGFPEIVLSKNGYTIYKSSMKIQSGREYNLKLSLTPSSLKRKLKPLADEEKAMLKNKLIGNDENFIKILNENELAVMIIGGQQYMSSKSPLIIQNSIAGYRLHYFVNNYPLEGISKAPIKYEQLSPIDMKQTINWERNRKNLFEGSQRHWLMSIVSNQLKQEGYVIQDEAGNELDGEAFISGSSLDGYSKLTIKQPLTIVYKGSNGIIETSHIAMTSPVDVNTAGLLINAKAFTVKGDMTKRSLAWQLPIDYEPINGDVENVYAQTIERFYERVYVHTDKPYYYPGEPIWFKGYINYKEPNWRDSLSKVIYLELINPEKKIMLSKILKIDSGLFSNDFILPDSLKEGTYYLRAYTNLNRNFGDSSLFVKAIPVLNITDKVDPSQGRLESIENTQLTITTEKKAYKTREKVTLTLQTDDKDGKPLAANLSISVTDAIQVVPIQDSLTIMNGYTCEKKKEWVNDLKYPVEYGISFTGKFLNDNGRPEQTDLTVLQMKPRNMILNSTDEQGNFSLTSLDFYDTATFSFKSNKAKEYPYGRVELLPKEVAQMDFKECNYNLTIQSTELPQRIISEFEVPNGVRMLDDVEIHATRIEGDQQHNYLKRPYGKPDYVLKSKEISPVYGNLLLALQGKFPGLIIRQADDGWVVYTIRGKSSSKNYVKEVLVMVNDVPMGGSPAHVLYSINPESVESVEFTNRINVLYGSFSGFGVLSIYTKHGISESDLNNMHKPNFQLVKVLGYSSSRELMTPDYNDETTNKSFMDYRSTIYWNPDVITDSKTGLNTVSFFSADLPGMYRIVVEGVSANGEPLRCVYFIEITSN